MKTTMLSTAFATALLLLTPTDHQVSAQTLAAVESTVMLPETITSDYRVWLDRVDKLSASLDENNGFLRLKGDIVDVLVFNREEGKKLLLARYAPSLEKAGTELPEDFFAPLDSRLDALWAEIERLAPAHTTPQGTTP